MIFLYAGAGLTVVGIVILINDIVCEFRFCGRHQLGPDMAWLEIKETTCAWMTLMFINWGIWLGFWAVLGRG